MFQILCKLGRISLSGIRQDVDMLSQDERSANPWIPVIERLYGLTPTEMRYNATTLTRTAERMANNMSRTLSHGLATRRLLMCHDDFVERSLDSQQRESSDDQSEDGDAVVSGVAIEVLHPTVAFIALPGSDSNGPATDCSTYGV